MNYGYAYGTLPPAVPAGMPPPSASAPLQPPALSYPLTAAASLTLQPPHSAAGPADAATGGAAAAGPQLVNAPHVGCVVEEVAAGPAISGGLAGQPSAAVKDTVPAGDPHAAAAADVETAAAADGAAAPRCLRCQCPMSQCRRLMGTRPAQTAKFGRPAWPWAASCPPQHASAAVSVLQSRQLPVQHLSLPISCTVPYVLQLNGWHQYSAANSSALRHANTIHQFWIDQAGLQIRGASYVL